MSETGSHRPCPGYRRRTEPEAEADNAHHIGVSCQTLQKVNKDFERAANLNAFLQRNKRETPPVLPQVTGEGEARIIALACRAPPEGYAGWTLRLCVDTWVELPYIDSLSPMTVSRL